jgi:hypothetical protein
VKVSGFFKYGFFIAVLLFAFSQADKSYCGYDYREFFEANDFANDVFVPVGKMEIKGSRIMSETDFYFMTYNGEALRIDYNELTNVEEEGLPPTMSMYFFEGKTYISFSDFIAGQVIELNENDEAIVPYGKYWVFFLY